MAILRQSFSPEFKAQVVLDMLTGMKTGSEACREYGIGTQLLPKWEARFLVHAASVFKNPTEPHNEDKAHIAELERCAGR